MNWQQKEASSSQTERRLPNRENRNKIQEASIWRSTDHDCSNRDDFESGPTCRITVSRIECGDGAHNRCVHFLGIGVIDRLGKLCERFALRFLPNQPVKAWLDIGQFWVSISSSPG